MIAPPRGSCLKWHASLGVSPCPGGLHLPGGQRQALSGTWGDRGPRSLVRGEPCQLLAQPGGSTPPPASHSPGRQQGCPPRAGERRPWEPGRALIYPRVQNSLFPLQHTAFGLAAGWFLWLLSSLHCRPWPHCSGDLGLPGSAGQMCTGSGLKPLWGWISQRK